MYVKAFISYGKHDNEPLIHLYGFAIPDNSEEIYNFVDPLQVGTPTRLLFEASSQSGLTPRSFPCARPQWLTETDVCLREEKDACLQDASLLTGYTTCARHIDH